MEAVLSDLYELSLQHERLEHGHSAAVLRAMSAGLGGVEGTLHELAARRWARESERDHWKLTPEGRAEAERRFADREARS
jgi:hypothetical protein